MNYIDYLEDVATEDVAGLKKAQQSYGDSWKSRGGVGAFMMLARKWDRLEQQVSKQLFPEQDPTITLPGEVVSAYDIFAHIEADTRSEGVIDDIRDLRRYLMLVEAEMRARGAASANSEHRDNS